MVLVCTDVSQRAVEKLLWVLSSAWKMRAYLSILFRRDPSSRHLDIKPLPRTFAALL